MAMLVITRGYKCIFLPRNCSWGGFDPYPTVDEVLVDCGTGIALKAVYDLHPTCRSFCCKEVAATVQPDGFTSKVGVLRRQDHL